MAVYMPPLDDKPAVFASMHLDYTVEAARADYIAASAADNANVLGGGGPAAGGADAVGGDANGGAAAPPMAAAAAVAAEPMAALGAAGVVQAAAPAAPAVGAAVAAAVVRGSVAGAPHDDRQHDYNGDVLMQPVQQPRPAANTPAALALAQQRGAGAVQQPAAAQQPRRRLFQGNAPQLTTNDVELLSGGNSSELADSSASE
ncbi:hypothetical protein HXX76_014507 [Chlamydomonas incerta]|uniref:Uncharacterized protein n=1 Tax=Chlamydomonas incerta TaxID=51695 RepID=A0A835SPJ1_CHLIN|nr:hypothetical protein HXX76_014507 [Chlamydomonas incerta]|eukprot:KAG2424455.1 hypothetical protein HXX76_014507 [Chlamydomonas incerta]